MQPLDRLSFGEAAWERERLVSAEALEASRRLRRLPVTEQSGAIEDLSGEVRRYVVLSIAITRATGLLALAYGAHTDEEIADYAASIPEPAGELARRWARDEWSRYRHQPADVSGSESGGDGS